MKLGHDVVLLPAYTPLLTDEVDVSERRVVFGGINLYLQGRFRLFRRTAAFDFMLDHPRVLGWASRFAVDTDPRNLGAMTRDTFLGTRGPYRREHVKLIDMLKDIRPEIVHLTNSMLSCMAEPIKQHLGIPVVCSLQGEPDFLAALPEPYRSECYDLLRENAVHVDHFVASCNDQVGSLSAILGDALGRCETVLPGICLDGYVERPNRQDDQFVIGFLARVAENKGVPLLAEAVDRLKRAHPDHNVQLRIAGWRAPKAQKSIDRLRERFGFEDCGFLSRKQKIEFLAGLDAFCVPATYPAAKGLYVLEALAAGVPAVMPRIGVFPQLHSATQGGLLFEPNNSADLAATLADLMANTDRATALGSMGRQTVLQRFHADRMALDTLGVYRRVAS